MKVKYGELDVGVVNYMHMAHNSVLENWFVIAQFVWHCLFAVRIEFTCYILPFSAL